MTINMHVGDMFLIWDFNDDQRDQIGIGKCKDPSLVPTYGVRGVDNYMVFTIISMIEALEGQRLFCPTLVA
jgi:hypothetical protein